MFALSARRFVVAVLTVTALALLTATAASGQAVGQPNQPALTRANELLAALSTDQKIQLALGNFAALASFGVPKLKVRRRTGRAPQPGYHRDALRTGARGDVRPRARVAYGSVVGSEARGEGFNEWLGPAVDIDRTPLAGRQPEAEGEDPFLAGNTAAQVIAGAQSQHMISTLKHYTAYNQDCGRIGFDIDPGRPRRRRRDRVRARAAGDLRGAVPHRRAAGRAGLGDVLL